MTSSFEVLRTRRAIPFDVIEVELQGCVTPFTPHKRSLMNPHSFYLHTCPCSSADKVQGLEVHEEFIFI